MTRNSKAKAQKALAPLMSQAIPTVTNVKPNAQLHATSAPQSNESSTKNPKDNDPQTKKGRKRKNKAPKAQTEEVKTSPKLVNPPAREAESVLANKPQAYNLKVAKASIENTKANETLAKKSKEQNAELNKAPVVPASNAKADEMQANKTMQNSAQEPAGKSNSISKAKKNNKSKNQKQKGAQFSLTLEALDYVPPSKASDKANVDTASISEPCTINLPASSDANGPGAEQHTQVGDWNELDNFAEGSNTTESDQQGVSSGSKSLVVANLSTKVASLCTNAPVTGLPDFLKWISPVRDLKKNSATPAGILGLIPREIKIMILSKLDYGTALKLQMTSTYYRDHNAIKPQDMTWNSKAAFIRAAEKYPIHCGLKLANNKQQGYGCFGCFKIKPASEFEEWHLEKQKKGSKDAKKRLCLDCEIKTYGFLPSHKIYDGNGELKYFCVPCNGFKGGLHCAVCNMCSDCLELPKKYSMPGCPRCKCKTARLQGISPYCRNSGIMLDHRLGKEIGVSKKKRGIPPKPRALTQEKIDACW